MTRWAPAVILLAGWLMVRSVGLFPRMPLREPLDRALPREIGGWPGHDVPMVSQGQLEFSGVSAYLNRVYTAPPATAEKGAAVYVGYYDRQTDGKTVHSPKNCLPGAGWEELESSTTTMQVAGGIATVNRYLIRKGRDQALVLYWYQGRGRIESNEYAVKWNLLRDAALRRRTDEALVRIFVPVTKTEASALITARGIAEAVVNDVIRALPT